VLDSVRLLLGCELGESLELLDVLGLGFSDGLLLLLDGLGLRSRSFLFGLERRISYFCNFRQE
jgi:hypothetical protein